MHTIYRFKAREVRSPTLQTVYESELKRRSYSHWKTTAPSWAKISQLRNQLRNQPFLAKPPASTPVPLCKLKFHLRSYEPRCEIISKLRTKLRNHLQAVNEVAKPPPSCKINLFIVKWTIQLEKSTCVISDIYNRLS